MAEMARMAKLLPFLPVLPVQIFIKQSRGLAKDEDLTITQVKQQYS